MLNFCFVFKIFFRFFFFEKDLFFELENEWLLREKDFFFFCWFFLFLDFDFRLLDFFLEFDFFLLFLRLFEDLFWFLFLGVGDFGRSFLIFLEYFVRKSLGFLLKYLEYILVSKFEFVSFGFTVNYLVLIVLFRLKTWRRRLSR